MRTAVRLSTMDEVTVNAQVLHNRAGAPTWMRSMSRARSSSSRGMGSWMGYASSWSTITVWCLIKSASA
eukprot:scaffold80046_cov19-Tisochrysis_lutea.AAC.1